MMSSDADINRKLKWEKVLCALQSQKTELSCEPQDESASYVEKGKGSSQGHDECEGRGKASKSTSKLIRGSESEN